MPRNGYEADRQRLCILDIASGEKRYVTESFDSNVDDFVWRADNNTLYYIGVWHATVNLYRTNLEGQVAQLTNDQADWGALQLIPSSTTVSPASADGAASARLLMERHDFFHPADLYTVSVGDSSAVATRLTAENDHILSQLAPGSSEPRWCKTTDGLQLLYWVIKPPHFDPSKKYPTLLFCEGGPQSPVSQFWSYRWNFYIMASQGYVIIAPNRRGLPGFGQEWLEEISGDWTGQCMRDYLSAIDDACDSLPYVDRDRMGAVGASFGGFSVYYLAGHHDKRFKCFISHDGAFNLEAMYTETEENWFSNWEYDDAFWNRDQTANAKRTYDNSPHRFVDKWDTPILCIHGEKDYRINATQGMSAFNAARMRGIEAELLLYPDENHWVLHPQNGILWQRTYFIWLARWLK
jgi:dipeptidyl aminopeptidase/acylaminoacyl peptidase